MPAYLRRPRVDPGALTSTNRGVFGFNLIWLTEREDMLAAELGAMTRALAGGAPGESRPPHVGREFGFGELPAALAFLQSGASVGKVVVRVDGEYGAPPV